MRDLGNITVLDSAFCSQEALRHLSQSQTLQRHLPNPSVQDPGKVGSVTDIVGVEASKTKNKEIGRKTKQNIQGYLLMRGNFRLTAYRKV